MSAAKQFTLEATGPQVRCDFRGCILDAWHDGDHQFPAPKPKFAPDRVHKCEVCGLRFVMYGEDKEPSLLNERRTCGSQACILDLAHRESNKVPVMCRCPQRDYPHDLSVHALIRSEWWKKKLRDRWPWSLMQSRREEPSTERSAA